MHRQLEPGPLNWPDLNVSQDDNPSEPRRRRSRVEGSIPRLSCHLVTMSRRAAGAAQRVQIFARSFQTATGQGTVVDEPSRRARAKHDRSWSSAWRLLAALTALGCSKPSAEEAPRATKQGALVTPASAAPAAHSRHPLELSAYTATLAVDGEDIYVLAGHGAYRFSPGRAAERWEMELGDTPAVGARGIVYWLEGELRRAPKRGGSAEILAAVPRPRRLCASGGHLVWEEPAQAAAQLRTLDGSEPRTIYRSEGEIAALALMDDQAYFVERVQERWRIGTVALSGGAARFTEARTSRTPALLAAAQDVFFYDGPTSTVRRVASDLSREDVVARDVICSPLAVADRVYCAQISLLFEVPRDGGKARLLAAKRPGTIAALVATRARVAWLLDTGDSRAELEMLSR